MVTKLYKIIFEYFIGGAIERVDGYKTLIGLVLTVVQVAYYLILGEGSQYDAQFHALVTLFNEHGHYALVQESAILTIVGLADKAAKAIAQIWIVIQNEKPRPPQVLDSNINNSEAIN